MNIMLLTVFGIAVFFCVGISVIATLYWARSLAQRNARITYCVRDPDGIESLEPVLIGGVKQYLHIRGRNRNNPILLFLHGGPGNSHIGWYDEIQRPWEDHFTVVQWDQRQVGKSYIKPRQKGLSISYSQIVDDTEEVIKYLRDTFAQEKIFVMGWSFGTYLGMKIVKRRPEWIHAYIALGQLVNEMDNFREEHALLLDYAISQGNEELVRKLRAMMPRIDPQNKLHSFIEHCASIRQELVNIGKDGRRYVTIPDETFTKKYSLFTSPHHTLIDLLFRQRAGRGGPPFMAYADGLMDGDLPKEVGSKFDAPIFFFNGGHDWHIPYTLTDKWFQEIEAPYKEQVFFQGSAHFVMQDEPGKLLVALVNKVLPLAQQNKADGADNSQYQARGKTDE